MGLAITDSPLFEQDDRRRAVIALGCALAGGAITQGLFWRTGVGLNFFLWDLLTIAASVAFFRRGSIRPTAWGAMAAAVLLGLAVVVRASEWAIAIALPFTLGVLAALPILLRDGLSLEELARLPLRMLASLGGSVHAVREAARTPGRAAGGRGRAGLRGVVLGLAVGAPIAGLFTLLLASDSDFARALAWAEDQAGEGVRFGIACFVTSAGYLVTHALHAGPHLRNAALAISSPAEGPYRAGESDVLLEPPAKARVSVVTWAMVIGQVSLVFALFVAANLKHLFGDHAFVRAPGAVTYASYLHAGFAQLLFATILSVGLVLFGHGLLRARAREGSDILAREAVPGGALLIALETTLLVLTAITLASCWQRLQIYEDAYGASHLRLGVAVVEVAVLGVLALTLGKVLRRRWQGYGGAVLSFGTLVAVVAALFNADAYVATANLGRALRGRPLDVEYLESLSADARGALDHEAVRQDSALRARLSARYCAREARDVRAMRGIGGCSAVAR